MLKNESKFGGNKRTVLNISNNYRTQHSINISIELRGGRYDQQGAGRRACVDPATAQINLDKQLNKKL